MAMNLDMFSFLPDSLLLFIVSLLPYQEAVKTSILSKKWLETWRNSKKIDVEFNEILFLKSNESDDDESKQAKRRDFLDLIARWISHNADLFVENFSLRVSDPESCCETIERCVAFATQRGVKELSLDFSDPNWKENNMEFHRSLMWLPQHVYELWPLLESLKLYSCGFSMSHMLKFRSLKEISLGWIEISQTGLRALLRTCKTIESLSLKKCCKLESFEMGDEKLGLKRLVIDKCKFKCNYFLFNAPKLEFFKYSGGVWISHIDINENAMEEAEIEFPIQYEPEFDYYYGDRLCTILKDFYPVKVLTVCSFLLQTIPSVEDETIGIKCGLNVRHLILKTQMHPYELHGFTFLLHSCPWLEKLTLEISPRTIFLDYEPPYSCKNVNLEEYWEGLPITAKCLVETLKVVEIMNCAGSLHEIRACLYLIQFGEKLEKMNIHILKDEQEEGRRRVMTRILPGIPKASKDLNISIA